LFYLLVHQENKKQEPVNTTTTNVEIVKRSAFGTQARTGEKYNCTKNSQLQKRRRKLLSIFPVLPREFRAAWVASVATNINWPSKNNLSTAEQQQEAIGIWIF
jgi:hypothetical protein